jgi:hypothetical protein
MRNILTNRQLGHACNDKVGYSGALCIPEAFIIRKIVITGIFYQGSQWGQSNIDAHLMF